MKSNDRDQIVGKARELKGNVKEKMGRALNNPRMEDEGRIDRASGKVRKKIGDIKQVFEE